MGLMVSQKLIELNQGSIWVHSDGKQKGSIFSFKMKMKLPREKRSGEIEDHDEKLFGYLEKIDTNQNSDNDDQDKISS